MQQMRPERRRKISLARTGRTQAEYQLVLPHRLDVRALCRRTWPGHPARAGLERPAAVANRQFLRQARSEADLRIDIAQRKLFAGFESLIEGAQDRNRALTGLRSALDRDQIAALRKTHAEFLFQTDQVAAVIAC